MRFIPCSCGKNSYSVFFELKKATDPYTLNSKTQNFKVLKCTSCNLLRNFPFPKFCGKTFNEPEQAEFYVNRKPLFKKLLSETFAKVYQHKKSGNFLDIGCSVGILLEIAKEKGFNVSGVEANSFAADYANSVLGEGTVKNSLLENTSFEKNSLDVITLNHVFEHVPNASQTLKKIHSLLKKQGILLIAVPDCESSLAKVKGRNWRHWQPEHHVFHYSPETLSNLLKKHSFKLLSLTHEKPFFGLSRNPITFWDKLYYQYILRLSQGDAMVAVAKKV